MCVCVGGGGGGVQDEGNSSSVTGKLSKELSGPLYWASEASPTCAQRPMHLVILMRSWDKSHTILAIFPL